MSNKHTPDSWDSLMDSDWMNVVNSDAVKDEGDDGHGAACQAFKLTEARCRELNEPTLIRLKAERDELHTALRHMTNEYIRTRQALNGETAEQCESIVCVGGARRAMAKVTGA